MRARSWRFSRFAALLEPGWYILQPGLFDALKTQKKRPRFPAEDVLHPL